MARRKFAKLKALMFESEITQKDLVGVIGRKTTYISHRMTGAEPWNLNDVRKIAEFLEIPREQWLNYFMDE